VTGQWVVLHGTRLGDMPGAATAVIIEPARSAKLAELIVLAYGFTPRELSKPSARPRVVTAPVCQRAPSAPATASGVAPWTPSSAPH